MTKDRDALSAALSQRSPGGHPPLLMTKSGGSAQEKLVGTGQAGPCGRLTEETPLGCGSRGESHPGQEHGKGTGHNHQRTELQLCSLARPPEPSASTPAPHPPLPSVLKLFYKIQPLSARTFWEASKT